MKIKNKIKPYLQSFLTSVKTCYSSKLPFFSKPQISSNLQSSSSPKNIAEFSLLKCQEISPKWAPNTSFYDVKNGGDLYTCSHLLQSITLFRAPLNQSLNSKNEIT